MINLVNQALILGGGAYKLEVISAPYSSAQGSAYLLSSINKHHREEWGLVRFTMLLVGRRRGTSAWSWKPRATGPWCFLLNWIIMSNLVYKIEPPNDQHN